jgi:hypothetical protein
MRGTPLVSKVQSQIPEYKSEISNLKFQIQFQISNFKSLAAAAATVRPPIP